MKTWEMMIKELTENPEKKFYDKNEPEAGEVYFDGRAIRWQETAEPLKLILLHQREWEEVRKPIGFVELLKRISKEGDITVDFEDYMDEHNFKDANLGEVLLHLSKEFTGDCLAETLLKSKWYIKE